MINKKIVLYELLALKSQKGEDCLNINIHQEKLLWVVFVLSKLLVFGSIFDRFVCLFFDTYCVVHKSERWLYDFSSCFQPDLTKRGKGYESTSYRPGGG